MVSSWALCGEYKLVFVAPGLSEPKTQGLQCCGEMGRGEHRFVEGRRGVWITLEPDLGDGCDKVRDGCEFRVGVG